MKTAVLLILTALGCLAQGVSPKPGGSATIACVGTPGNTTGAYRQQCQDTNGLVYACNNTGGCTLSGQWVKQQGSGSFTALSGDATSTATGGATTVVKINGTSFAGTSGHIVSFGAANIPADSGVVAANVLAVSAPAAHSVLLGAGTQAPGTAGPNAATTYPLFSAGSSADPAFRAIAAADIPSALRARAVGMSFNGGGSAIAVNSISYIAAVPFAGTISAWDLCVDTGTATVDVFKIATGTGLPTASITASATPAIASNNCLHSTTLTGWTTSVAAGDRLAFKVTAISAATNISIVLEVDQ